MSLLDVFVILAYYSDAKANGTKITDQKFDNEYIVSKIKEIKKCHSSALHWNLNELKSSLPCLIGKAKDSYALIEQKTKIVLHSASGMEGFKAKIDKDIAEFMSFSRLKAKEAQARELAATQPKEFLTTNTKSKITIGNYLGGLYYFTVDETRVDSELLYLIESKHAKNAVLPSKGDIKDGLLKMILYANLRETTLNGKKIKHIAVLRLMSTKIKGGVSSDSPESARTFAADNKMSPNTEQLIETLFCEARENGFIVEIKGAS
ncbi:MAG: hypothetical protein LBI57_03095 [Helicobacteraceae bacterium]|jgi:hypothetical protein|nr:hypothetical protein [Helicobacteraceae bacterium]